MCVSVNIHVCVHTHEHTHTHFFNFGVHLAALPIAFDFLRLHLLVLLSLPLMQGAWWIAAGEASQISVSAHLENGYFRRTPHYPSLTLFRLRPTNKRKVSDWGSFGRDGISTLELILTNLNTFIFTAEKNMWSHFEGEECQAQRRQGISWGCTAWCSNSRKTCSGFEAFSCHCTLKYKPDWPLPLVLVNSYSIIRSQIKCHFLMEVLPLMKLAPQWLYGPISPLVNLYITVNTCSVFLC